MDNWTAEELAKAACVTQRWVTELCALGKPGPFPNAQKRAGVWFIPFSEGQAWLDARRAAEQQQKPERESGGGYSISAVPIPEPYLNKRTTECA